MQRAALQEIKEMGASLDDDVTIPRFTLNEEKATAAQRTLFFFAIVTYKLEVADILLLSSRL